MALWAMIMLWAWGILKRIIKDHGNYFLITWAFFIKFVYKCAMLNIIVRRLNYSYNFEADPKCTVMNVGWIMNESFWIFWLKILCMINSNNAIKAGHVSVFFPNEHRQPQPRRLSKPKLQRLNFKFKFFIYF